MPTARSKEAVRCPKPKKTHYGLRIGDVQSSSRGKQAEKAPRVCCAKGVDYLAEEIMRLAREAGIPLVSNPPLARTLYAACDAGEEILAEHYQAVAEVISYVWKLKGKRAA